jgi:hypothetical protein
MNGFHTFRFGYGVDLDFRRFTQKCHCSEQNAESMRPDMMVQIFTGRPLLHQAETVPVFDIAKEGIAQAARFLSRWFDHGDKRLRKLQLFFRNYVHYDIAKNHCSFLAGRAEHHGMSAIEISTHLAEIEDGSFGGVSIMPAISLSSTVP